MFMFFFLTGLLFFLASRRIYNHTSIIAPWIVIFTCVWSLPVAIIWYYSGVQDFSYAFSSFQHLGLPGSYNNNLIYLLVALMISSFLMLLGSYLADSIIVPKVYDRELLKSPKGIVRIIFFIWLCLVFFIIQLNKYPWYFIFLPTYADGDIYVNYIFRVAYMTLPLIGFFLACSVKGKKELIFSVLWLFVVSVSTGQRRNVISAILFGAFILYSNRHGLFSLRKILTYSKFLTFFTLSFSLVVILWVLRVVTTNLVQNDVWVNPFENRSFIDIMFGSAATGLPTTYSVLIYNETEGASFLYNIYYGIAQIIPRGIWEDKPVGIDTILQEYYYLDVSPSVFWFGDLIFCFGLLLFPIASFLLSFFLTVIQRVLFTKNGVLCYFLSALVFSNLFTLYKNGLGTFISSVSTSFFVFLLFYFLAVFPLLKLREVR